ncbi:type IV pilin protein [Marinicella gelatinilytica]|uniref:type IV pilin protein n=1 Tax=Marinicella gelatinilytica TaxID=2996017 RepID=UPI002B2053FF|nr:type IV pilin protein [Marinicella gelatinilytica]
MRKVTIGFTLIELLVVIAIVAMLAAYAIPNYRQYVIESKRTEAQNRLLEIAGMFEKHYANTNSYPDGLTGAGATKLGLSNDFLSWENYQVSADFSGGWTLTATAIGGQAQDTECPTINYNNLGQKTPLNCWQ